MSIVDWAAVIAGAVFVAWLIVNRLRPPRWADPEDHATFIGVRRVDDGRTFALLEQARFGRHGDVLPPAHAVVDGRVVRRG
jgi:hypothetical protein